MNDTTSLPVNWLEMAIVDYEPSTTACDTVTGGSINAGFWTNGNVWDYGVPYTVPYTEPTYYYHYWPNWKETVKIRLTMTDVEKLRAAAKKDKTLKKVLQKIGPHIEVEVDF